MADSKRYNGSTWEHSLRKLTTATDTITTLPADIYANDTTAAVGLKGNTVQSTTPTPDNPIMPEGCGERTGNLWDNRGFSASAINLKYAHNISNNYGTTLSTTEGNEVTITQSEYPTGTIGYQNGFFTIDVDFSKYAIGDVVTISFDYIVNEIHALSTQRNTTVYVGKDSNMVPNTLSSGDWKISGRLTATITIIADMRPYIEVRLCGNSITVKNIMLNAGSTALPYEPYGYKLDISSASTTTPVYLGEVETTRKIKKLVLDGTESLVNAGGNAPYRLPINDIARSSSTSSIEWYCSHYQSLSTNDSWASYDYCISRTSTAAQSLQFRDVTKGDITAFKQYLAAQYAAGTPVTVWYVLANPETGIVNEPLMKIGDYADTLSNISIPVTAGGDILSVGTTVQPSEVSVNYKGWHPKTPKESNDGSWT